MKSQKGQTQLAVFELEHDTHRICVAIVPQTGKTLVRGTSEGIKRHL
jgi:hypothetical protein